MPFSTSPSLGAGPSTACCTLCQKERHSAFSAEFDQRVRKMQGALGIVTQHLELSPVEVDGRHGAHMTGFDGIRERAFN